MRSRHVTKVPGARNVSRRRLGAFCTAEVESDVEVYCLFSSVSADPGKKIRLPEKVTLRSARTWLSKRFCSRATVANTDSRPDRSAGLTDGWLRRRPHSRLLSTCSNGRERRLRLRRPERRDGSVPRAGMLVHSSGQGRRSSFPSRVHTYTGLGHVADHGELCSVCLQATRTVFSGEQWALLPVATIPGTCGMCQPASQPPALQLSPFPSLHTLSPSL